MEPVTGAEYFKRTRPTAAVLELSVGRSRTILKRDSRQLVLRSDDCFVRFSIEKGRLISQAAKHCASVLGKT